MVLARYAMDQPTDLDPAAVAEFFFWLANILRRRRRVVEALSVSLAGLRWASARMGEAGDSAALWGLARAHLSHGVVLRTAHGEQGMPFAVSHMLRAAVMFTSLGGAARADAVEAELWVCRQRPGGWAALEKRRAWLRGIVGDGWATVGVTRVLDAESDEARLRAAATVLQEIIGTRSSKPWIVGDAQVLLAATKTAALHAPTQEGVAGARDHLQEAWAVFQGAGDLFGMSVAALANARLYRLEGHVGRAVVLARWAQGCSARMHDAARVAMISRLIQEWRADREQDATQVPMARSTGCSCRKRKLD